MEVRDVIVGAPSVGANEGSGKPTLKRVRLELAWSEKFPWGSFRHGYEFIAPLDGNRYIDMWQWRKLRAHCCVRRFWADEPDQIGRLIHKPGDETPVFWAFDCASKSFGANEADYRFGAHAFVPGEHIAMHCRGGEAYTLRVVSVHDLCRSSLK